MKQITQKHCQACGSTAEENVGTQATWNNSGYSMCCNERIVRPEYDPVRRTTSRCRTYDQGGDCYHA